MTTIQPQTTITEMCLVYANIISPNDTFVHRMSIVQETHDILAKLIQKLNDTFEQSPIFANQFKIILEAFQEIYDDIMVKSWKDYGMMDTTIYDLNDLEDMHDDVVCALVYLRAHCSIAHDLDNAFVQYLYKCCTSLPNELCTREALKNHSAFHGKYDYTNPTLSGYDEVLDELNVRVNTHSGIHLLPWDYNIEKTIPSRKLDDILDSVLSHPLTSTTQTMETCY